MLVSTFHVRLIFVRAMHVIASRHRVPSSRPVFAPHSVAPNNILPPREESRPFDRSLLRTAYSNNLSNLQTL
jgi:hypothetical protein